LMKRQAAYLKEERQSYERFQTEGGHLAKEQR
jgi:hypothetical protein